MIIRSRYVFYAKPLKYRGGESSIPVEAKKFGLGCGRCFRQTQTIVEKELFGMIKRSCILIQFPQTWGVARVDDGRNSGFKINSIFTEIKYKLLRLNWYDIFELQLLEIPNISSWTFQIFLHNNVHIVRDQNFNLFKSQGLLWNV